MLQTGAEESAGAGALPETRQSHSRLEVEVGQHTRWHPFGDFLRRGTPTLERHSIADT